MCELFDAGHLMQKVVTQALKARFLSLLSLQCSVGNCFYASMLTTCCLFRLHPECSMLLVVLECGVVEVD